MKKRGTNALVCLGASRRTLRAKAGRGERGGPRRFSQSLLLLAAAVAVFALLACSEAPSSAPAADAGALAECSGRADCAAKGDDFAGLVCGATGRCEHCVSDGQCELRERCDPETRRCGFKPGLGDECALNGDCDAGELCVQGLCVAEPEAVLCVDGACLADGLRCHRVNGVCEEDIGCLSDLDCSATEACNLPTHTCAVRCVAEDPAATCGPGQHCVESRCSDCADSSDCPGGLVCDLDLLACVTDGSARCLSDRDCEVGKTCNAATGFCTPKPPPCLSDDGCLPDERCQLSSGRCLPRSCQPDRLEPNDDIDSAEPIAAGGYSQLTLCDHEQDWFSLELSRGDRVDVFVDANPLLEGALEARMLDATGRTLSTGRLALNCTVADAGTYYLRMQSTDLWVEYGLRLSISSGAPCDVDRFEENDEPATATEGLEAGDYDGLTVCGADQDFFALTVPPGEGARIELHHLPSEGDLDLFVLAADGAAELARSATVAAVEAVELAASAVPEDGRILVKVASEDSRARSLYFLRIGWLP